MEGDSQIIELLNEQLTAELTAVHQFFLHAKMQQDWGYVRLAKHTRSEAHDELKHAERLTERILFLEGAPNYQDLSALRIGQGVPEQLRNDLALELETVTRLRAGVELMRSRGDITSARIFEEILADEEEHVDYLETELGLLESLGEHNYLQRLTDAPGEDFTEPV
ncbi:bacterioferritin [Actinomadura terrae]|uniref:bacterioferritin n=1 Tax=Actinomadura terrae TaxID=604353 RepID=UPI001FA7714E|nr:bacterioferritin [Actinomadura terrae]